MKKTLCSLLFVGTILAASNVVFSQQLFKGDVTKAEEYLKEVNKNCIQYVNEEQIIIAKDFLSRTIVHVMPKEDFNHYSLSEVTHKNKCNPELLYSISSFDPAAFNPLKYHFNWYAQESRFYRLEGTEYVIEILPKK
jgi:hydroxymethylpyrimidine pyrophosphatase-like HAD family hydrolase